MNPLPLSLNANNSPIQSPQRLILAIEDSDEDYETFRRYFRRVCPPDTQLQRYPTGKQALAYLQDCTTTTDDERVSTLPSLILLDLNLPGIDGIEVLKIIKHDPRWQQIPTVILTTSNNPKDIDRCYRLGANSYLVKAMNLELFRETIQVLTDYWMKIVLLPEQPAPIPTEPNNI